MTAADTISINSASVVPGDIPTRPAPQSVISVMQDCLYYYRKSFSNSIVPATALGVGTGEYYFPVNNLNGVGIGSFGV